MIVQEQFTTAKNVAKIKSIFRQLSIVLFVFEMMQNLEDVLNRYDEKENHDCACTIYNCEQCFNFTSQTDRHFYFSKGAFASTVILLPGIV